MAESPSPGRGECSTLEALPYDFGVCDRISATTSAESVAEGRLGAEGRSVAESHLGTECFFPEREEAAHWKLSLTMLASATESLRRTLHSRWQRFGGRESVVWAGGGSSTLEALPDDFGFYDRISATSSAELFGRRESFVQSQRVGRLVAEL